jgi:hypothetical protein
MAWQHGFGVGGRYAPSDRKEQRAAERRFHGVATWVWGGCPQAPSKQKGQRGRRTAAFVAWRHGFGVDARKRRASRKGSAGGGPPLLWRGGSGCWWAVGTRRVIGKGAGSGGGLIAKCAGCCDTVWFTRC